MDDAGDEPSGPRCGASFEGNGCAYEHGHTGIHWTITESGEVTWTEASVALYEVAAQLRRIAEVEKVSSELADGKG